MKVRRAFASLCATSAIFWSAESAFATDTLWDVLRKAEPTQRAATGPPPLTSIPTATPQVPSGSLWDVMRSNPTNPSELRLTSVGPNLMGQNVPQEPSIVTKTATRKDRGGILGFFDDIGAGLRRVGKAMNSEVKVSGQKYMGWHMEKVDGSAETYSNDHYYGQRGLGGSYDNTDLTVSGKMFGLVNFETRMSNYAYGNPYDNRLALNYANKGLKIEAGDINASISGNSLIDFNRTTKGLQIGADVARGIRVSGLWSQTKALTRTLVIPGGNGPGPYYVYTGMVVDGSERVRVNNRDMVKGEDYTLDPFTGELKFKAGTIIQYDDVIAVTFETYGYNSNPGVLTGGRMEFNLGKNARSGFSYVSQLNSNQQGLNRNRTDQFMGYDNPTTPYTLDFPIELIITKDAQGQIVSAIPKHPMIVTVAGFPKVFGDDFFVDPLLPNRVFFRLPIPSTQIVKITYVPASTDQTPGSRSVMGFDTFLPLGKYGNVVGEWASSRMDLAGNPIAGGAHQLRGDMKLLGDKLQWNWQYRNIDDKFTSIESPGFRRNEKGWTNGFTYLPSKNLRLNLTVDKSKRPAYDYGSFGSGFSGGYAPTIGMDDYTQTTFGANWTLGPSSVLSLQRNVMTTKMFNGGLSDYQTESLTYGHKWKSLGFDVSVGRNKNQSISYFQTQPGTTEPAEPTIYGSSSLTQRFNAFWKANDRLTFQGVFSTSQIDANARPVNAKDMQLSANATLLKNMTMRIGWQQQDSGGYSPFLGQTGTGTGVGTGSGAETGTGSGSGDGVLAPTRQGQLPGTGGGLYGGGSFNSGFNPGGMLGGGYNGGLSGYGNYGGGFYNPGLGGGFGYMGYGGKSNGINFGLDYQPWTNLNLGFTLSRAMSEGDYQFNSRRNDIGVTATYNLGQKLTFTGAFNMQNVNYIGAEGGSSTRMMFLSMSGNPLGKLGTQFSYQLMNSNSSYNAGTGTGTGTGTGGGIFGGGYGYGYGFGSGSTNLQGFSMRLDYPVWKGNKVFLQMDNTDSTGYFAALQRTMIIGLDIPITPIIAFQIGIRDQQNTSRGDSTGVGDYSYRVRSLDANLHMRFN